MGRGSYSEKEDRNHRRSERKKRDKKIKKEKKKIILKAGNNWTKDQLKIEDIPEEDLNQARSNYIDPNSALMQSYNLQNNQKKLFGNLLHSTQIPDQNDIKKSSYPQALPIIRRDTSTYYFRGNVPGVTNVLFDPTKIKKKIPINTESGFNYAGLIIGPKGSNQKRLEEETGCKILVRGRGSQKEGQARQHDDWENLHVLIAGDTEKQVNHAVLQINKILHSDEQTRNIIRQEQLRQVAMLKNTQYGNMNNDNVWDNFNYLGVANPHAFIIPVQNEYISTILGLGGDILVNIRDKSGAHNVHLATDSEPGSGMRNLYVEGSEKAFLKVKSMVDDIIEKYVKAKMKSCVSKEILECEIIIPIKSMKFIIGKGQSKLRKIEEEYNIEIDFKEKQDFESDKRILEIKGSSKNIMKAKHYIDMIISETVEGGMSEIKFENGKDFEKNVKIEENEDKNFDKGTGYYEELRNYFNLGLDFLDKDGEDSAIQVTEYYPDGRVRKLKTHELKI